jgi:hypothetical protein
MPYSHGSALARDPSKALRRSNAIRNSLPTSPSATSAPVRRPRKRSRVDALGPDSYLVRIRIDWRVDGNLDKVGKLVRLCLRLKRDRRLILLLEQLDRLLEALFKDTGHLLLPSPHRLDEAQGCPDVLNGHESTHASPIRRREPRAVHQLLHGLQPWLLVFVGQPSLEVVNFLPSGEPRVQVSMVSKTPNGASSPFRGLCGTYQNLIRKHVRSIVRPSPQGCPRNVVAVASDRLVRASAHQNSISWIDPDFRLGTSSSTSAGLECRKRHATS